MKKTRVVFFEIQETWQRELVTRSLPASRYELRFNSSPLSVSNAGRHKDADVVSVFIGSKVSRDVINRLPRLRLVATNSTGFDHIDLAACKARDLTVCNVPIYGENTVAEHTFALLLAITRKLIESANRTRTGKFSREGLRGFDLKGKTIGVIGTGNIGRHVIRIAHGFEMKILAFDLSPDRALENHYPLKFVPLERLLRDSDVVSLHVPYNSRTHHMLNAKNFKLFKKGSLLVNTARGGLVETAALLIALKSGRLAGAGLDVLEEESVIAGEDALISKSVGRDDLAVAVQSHQLMVLDNVVVTPHNAFNSIEAIHRIFTTTIENVKAWQAGKPQNLVK